jgi:hypothetical protein
MISSSFSEVGVIALLKTIEMGWCLLSKAAISGLLSGSPD